MLLRDRLGSHAADPAQVPVSLLQMISIYGMKKLAEQYLAEMYTGLVKNRKKSHRINLFAGDHGVMGSWDGSGAVRRF